MVILHQHNTLHVHVYQLIVTALPCLTELPRVCVLCKSCNLSIRKYELVFDILHKGGMKGNMELLGLRLKSTRHANLHIVID